MQGISVCWFYILQIHYIHWLALVLSGGVFRVLHVEDHVICKQWEFYFFFSNLDTFYFFFCSDCLAKTSKTMLNGSGESGNPCLVPDFRGNTFNFSPVKIMFAVGLSYIAFIIWRYVPTIPAFWRIFIINGCWFCQRLEIIIEIIIWLLFFNLLMWCITLIDLQILKNPCIPGIKPTWSWCMIFLICCWILFARILLRIFAFMFISDIGL